MSYKEALVAGRVAGWVDLLDCGTWAFFSAFEGLVVMKSDDVMRRHFD